MGKHYTTEFKLQTLQPILGKNEYQRRRAFLQYSFQRLSRNVVETV